MLPYFAATGHNNYTKSLYWFIQEMQGLKSNILDEFLKGLFVVRRTDQFWSAASPDLCIEQTLMASLKGSSGLTRGRSLSEINRLVWVLSRPFVLTIDSKLREMAKVRFRSSEQHIAIKTSLPSRLKKYEEDVESLVQFCKSRHLLTFDSLTNTDKRLRNVSNGLIAPKFVNITSVKACGEKILAGMSKKSLSTITMKKNNQAKQTPVAAAALDKCLGASIDSDLLFQRLISVPTDVPDLMKFELAHFPMSLFTDNGYL